MGPPLRYLFLCGVFMKAAVYSGTKNLYCDMVTAAKSLVANSSVDKVFFLIEDKTFPYDLPDIVETMDVSGQRFFAKGGANFQTSFTYMSLLRVCYTKLFPDLDKVLQLDVDTVVVDDIDFLWDVNLKGKWFAACREPLSSWKPYGPVYYNIGVAMFNLGQIRKDCIDERLIDFLNTVKVPYIDQDAWNRFGVNRAVDLPARFNESIVTGFSEEPAIVHFAGLKDWQTNLKACRREYLKKYREMSWEDVLYVKNSRSCSDV